MRKIKTPEMEVALARHFNYRLNVIVPNVSWGFGLNYEADLIIVTPLRYVTEIEIKVSLSDIKAEKKKRGFAHRGIYIRRFYFAVPYYLCDCEYIPNNCGLLSVDESLRVKSLRAPRHNSSAQKITDTQLNKLLHLGCMRIWTLKLAIASRR